MNLDEIPVGMDSEFPGQCYKAYLKHTPLLFILTTSLYLSVHEIFNQHFRIITSLNSSLNNHLLDFFLAWNVKTW